MACASVFVFALSLATPLSDRPLLFCARRQIAENLGELSLVEFCNRNADKVDLTGCGLTMLPAEVLLYHGDKVQQLKLANNKLTMLPKQLAAFLGLTTAVLDNNQFASLPDVRPCLLACPRPAPNLCAAPGSRLPCWTAESLLLILQVLLKLPLLSICMASCNQIRSLPADIGDRTQLQALVLQSNEISVSVLKKLSIYSLLQPAAVVEFVPI